MYSREALKKLVGNEYKGYTNNNHISFEVRVIIDSDGPAFWIRRIRGVDVGQALLRTKTLAGIKKHLSVLYPDQKISEIKGKHLYNLITGHSLEYDINFIAEQSFSNKKFLYSCHHLSEANKKVCIYMLKFMNLCKECSYETFYNVMQDKFDVSYNDRKEIVYRMLEDNVITYILPDTKNGDYRYKYTPEKVI